MIITWTSLIPPILVLLVAAITRHVLWSLIVGIIASGILIKNFALIATSKFIGYQLWLQLIDRDNLYVYIFLILLGALITLIELVGGANAYGNFLKKIINNARTTQLASIGLSIVFMIDDFFSCLTVGCIMRPLTDSFNIPRAKLAFLIDALASPLVIIMPVSTWIAMLLMQLNKAGISLDPADQPVILADPFLTYLYSIPYTLYSFSTLLSVMIIIYYRYSFGPMTEQENIAATRGNLFGGKPALHESKDCETQTGSIYDFALPLISLLVFIALFVLYSGNSYLFGGQNSVLATIQQADIFLALLLGCLASLSFSFLYMLAQRKISLATLNIISRGGIEIMYESIIILLLAWTFSCMIKDHLHTGSYLASLLIGTMPAPLLPAMLFIASLLTACVTGSSWGTIAIMLPLAVPMLSSFFSSPDKILTLSQIPLLMPSIGAIFSGAVAGDHLSPLGTTTVMAATSAGCYLSDHVSTQLPYGLPALATTLIGYLLAGYLIGPFKLWTSWIIVWTSSLILTASILWAINAYFSPKKQTS